MIYTSAKFVVLSIFVALLCLTTTPGLGQVTAGTGTAGKIPVWTGAHSQSNSAITQSGTKIGIGTIAPTSPLTVVSTTAVPAVLGTNAASYAVRGNSTSSVGVLGISTNNKGVVGTHNAASGGAAGVEGNTNSTSALATGVLGNVLSTTPSSDSAGVRGINNGTNGNGSGVYGSHNGGGYGVFGQSTSGFGLYGVSTDSYGGYFSSTNNDAADFHGANWGIYVRNSGGQPAVDAGSSGANSYAGYFYSNAYRAGYFKSGSNVLYSLYVDTQDGPTQGTAGLNVNGTIRGEGNLVIAGSKAGYVVDEMQNVDTVPLEQGDVVVIAADSGAPVLGKIPVPRIRLANSANDTAVVGIVDQIMYVPDDATRTAYEAQQKADRDAATQAQALARQGGQKLSPMADSPNRISDEAGTLHADPDATSAVPGRYCSVVTLGAYKAVKANANFGAIKAGDLLTTSPQAGYAMRVNDKVAASGAIIGKALSSLNSGTGTVSVLVTLK